jgi:hypothetical protein
MSDSHDDATGHGTSTASGGLTRRDLFYMSNALAMPVLFGLDGAAEAAPAAAAGPLTVGFALPAGEDGRLGEVNPRHVRHVANHS